MAVLVIFLLSTALSLSSACSSWSKPEPRSPTFVCEEEAPDSDLGELARSSNSFLIDLYQALEGDSGENIIISPFSIFTGLSLLHLGTAGDTRDNFQSALHFPAGQQNRVHQDGRKIIEDLEKMSSAADQTFILQTSNAVFLDTDFSISENYRSEVECFYQSKISTLPLAANPTQSAADINSWIKEKTHDRIEELISSDMLGGQSKAVLVNSVYFKAGWSFGKFHHVEDASFTRLGGEEMTVQMMSTQASVGQARLGDLGTVIQLGYDTCNLCDEEEADLALLVFLPDQGTTWSSWKSQVFQPDVISGKSLEMMESSTRLSLPKFEVKYEKNLTPILSDLGLDLAGDFSGLTDSSVEVSDVLTKTFLRVDEEGSEGAAATAVIMGRSMPRGQIRVDRTFILSIIHKKSGLVVFAGTVDEPTI